MFSLIITMMVVTRYDVNSCLIDFTKEVRCLMFALVLKHQFELTLRVSVTRIFEILIFHWSKGGFLIPKIDSDMLI